MNPKNIFVSIISLAVLFTISNHAFCITHAVGLSDDTRDYAQVVAETGSEIRIVFTPPESHQLLFSDNDPEASGYDFNGGYSTSSGIRIPAVTYWIVVPPRDRIELEIVRQHGRRLSTDIRDAANPFLDENVSALRQEQLNGFNPPAAVKVGRPQVMRGIRMVPVTIFPLQLQAENHRAVENSEIEIELKFSAGEAVNPVIDLRPARFSHGMARILEDFTLNPPVGLSPQRDLAATELARMLILYPEAIDNDEENEQAAEAREWIDRFAEWKQRMGYSVEVIAVDTEQDPDDIKSIIQDYYENGLEFLIIIGNEDSEELEALEENQPRLYFPTSRFVIDIVEEVEIYGYSEHEYSLMDGDDMAPDIIVSRMKVPTYSRLIGVLQRSIAYETDPYIEDNNWFTKALSTVERENQDPNDYALPYWTRSRLLREGYENIEILIGNNDWRIDEDQGIWDEIRDAVEGGVSLVFGDGTLYGIANGHIAEIENRMVNDWEQWNDFAETGRMNPFLIANFSDYELHIMYPFFASARKDTINGAIASVGIYDKNGPSPKIVPIIGSAVKAITSDDIYSVGYIQLITKMHLLSITERFDENDQGLIDGFIDALRLHWTLGDPTVDIFTAPPVELTVDHPESFIEGETSVLLHVTDTEDNDVSGVTVCIRQTQDNGIQYVMESNLAGYAAFTVPEGLGIGELLITAHKHNSIPYLVELPVRTVEMNLILAEYGFDDGDDGDNLFANGETVTLVLELENSGEADAEAVTALLSCDSNWLNYDDEPIVFGDIPHGETLGYEGEYLLDLHQNCPGGTLLRIQVDIYSGEEAISSAAFEITTSGPILTCSSIETDENFCGGGEGASFSPVIANLGDLPFSASTAVLESLDPLIEVTDAERNYQSIESNDERMPSEPFYLNIDPLFVANNPASFELHISAEGREFDTTLTISKIVPGREGGEPVGPDEYGYIAFDSGDFEDWYEAPWYKYYYEINPDIDGYNFHGTKIEYESDGRLHWNETTLIELPFTFRYYGEEFGNITVCTNGWISMGDGGLPFSTPHNRPIPGIAAPDGQICILWQDLNNNERDYQYCGVYYHYVEEEDLFIIEWSNISVDNRWIDDNDTTHVDRHPLSFQILLYDPEVYPTESGDGEIVFQYSQFTAATGNDAIRDHLYTTVGIRNLNGEGGLQYAYGNVYAEGANPINVYDEEYNFVGFAIKFTTAVENEYGSVTGRVLRAEGENEPLEEVEIRHPRFPSRGETDQYGTFRIRNLRASRYENVRVCKAGFNDQYISFTIEADQNTELDDIFMNHPELTIETEPADLEAISLRPDGTQLQVNLNLENDGNGPLEYEFTICNYDSSDIDYENIENWDLTSQFREPDCNGVVYVDSLFYILGRNSRWYEERGHLVYVFNRAGDTLRTFQQPMSNASIYGMINITWDGEKFWGSIENFERGENLIISFDENGELISEILSPFNYFSSLALTVNPETGNLFITDQNTGIVEIDNEGNVQSEFDLHRPGYEFNVTALGWNSYDPEGWKLYIIEKYRPGDDAKPVLYRMNHETGEYVEITELSHRRDPDSYRGMAVIRNLNNERTLIALVEGWGGTIDPNDHLRFYDAGPNLSFMADGVISSRIGIVVPQEPTQAGLLIDVDGWEEVTIPFGIKLFHNAAGEPRIIPVQLRVDPNSDIPVEFSEVPTEFAITSVYPNPFNSMVRIEFTVNIAKPTTLKVYDLGGREVTTLYEGTPEAGYHRITWNGVETACGVYFLKLQSEDRTRTVKTVIVK